MIAISILKPDPIRLHLGVNNFWTITRLFVRDGASSQGESHANSRRRFGLRHRADSGSSNPTAASLEIHRLQNAAGGASDHHWRGRNTRSSGKEGQKTGFQIKGGGTSHRRVIHE